MNVGAIQPEDSGDYFAWGETETKNDFNWSTYKYGNGSTFNRYSGSDFATLLREDDAARANWGGTWRMPTIEEWAWLNDDNNCTWEWTNDYLGDGSNKVGCIVTSKVEGYKQNSIFLPAVGLREDADILLEGIFTYYWSSSLVERYPNRARFAASFDGHDGNTYHNSNGTADRFDGLPVRPVTD